MKIRICSDIHLDFHEDHGNAFIKEITKGDFDLLIIAGDLCECSLLEESINKLMDNTEKVLYVPGNHDYYRAKKSRVINIFETLNYKYLNRFLVLDNDSVVIQDQLFLGTTLWFPWDRPTLTDSYLGDFLHIYNFTVWLEKQAKESYDFLKDNIDKETIVITHHMPHPKCISENFKNSKLNKYFVHDVGNLIKKPKLWIHGHTHDNVDFKIGNCRVLCNPLGYCGVGYVENKNFNYNLDLKL